MNPRRWVANKLAGVMEHFALSGSPLALEAGQPVALGPDACNELRMTRSGPMLFNKNDIYIGGSLRKYGEFSWLEQHLFSQLIEPGQVVVEAGANIGAHTVDLCRLVGPSGKVLAFEPQRLVFQMLCANLALNQCTNAHAFQAGLGAEPGELSVFALDPAARNNFGAVSLVAGGRGEQVAVRTLDSFNLAACHFLKVDVEGMELQVLRGGLETIRRCRPMMYLENDREQGSEDLLELVLSMGYTAYWHLPPLYNPDNFAGDDENIFPGVVSVNVICYPQEANIQTNLRRIGSPKDSWKPGA